MNTYEAEQLLHRLSRPWFDHEVPWLDRGEQPDGLSDEAAHWRNYGFVVLHDFIPHDLLDAYAEVWERDNPEDPQGYLPSVTPYMKVPELLDLCSDGPLHAVMAQLIGEPVAVHLNLTGWRSTQRQWHQDGYLNPDSNKDHYVAAWFALDDIDMRSGPFEFVPGSHLHYPPIRHELILETLEPAERHPADWPWHSERLLTPMFEALMSRDRVIPSRFHAKKGDVLLWHSRLLHQGTVPADPDLERRALIAHYSGVHHRPDFAPAKPHGDGWYFPFLASS